MTASRNFKHTESVSRYSGTVTKRDFKTGVLTYDSYSYEDSQQSTSRSKTRAWSNTPNYRQLVKAGLPLPDNHYSCTIIDGGHVSGGWSWTGPYGGVFRDERRYGTFSAYIPSAYEQYSPLKPASIASDLISRAKGAEWQAPVFFAEARKTAEMVSNGVLKVAHMAASLRRGDFPGFVAGFHPDYRRYSRRASRSERYWVNQFNADRRKFQRLYGRNPREAAANTWLEYTYGWLPFLLDARSMGETLASLALDEHSQIGRVTATKRATTTHDISSPDRFTLVAGVRVGARGQLVANHSIRGVFRFKPNSSLNAIGKLGLTNPLSVGWELVPFSFVADWFIPIGDYLSNLDAPLRISFLGGTYGYRTEVPPGLMVIRHSDKLYRFSPPSVKTAKYVRVRRVPMGGLPSLSLTDVWFDPSIGATRLTSAIALLHQNLSWFKRR